MTTEILATGMFSAILIWGGIILLSSVIAFGALWICICVAPADLFLRSGERPHDRHPILHLVWVIVRNILGGILILIGIFFVVFPGPGMPWLLLGLALVDLPGKKKMLHKAVLLPSVQNLLNWFRRRGAQRPFHYPEETPSEDHAGKTESDQKNHSIADSERANNV
ncbi:MAG TPA: hypothetical protein VNQ76_00530 [Planctomicrobium sp.]|nr:hypothetical protein [Planctomicrobium sp.]